MRRLMFCVLLLGCQGRPAPPPREVDAAPPMASPPLSNGYPAQAPPVPASAAADLDEDDMLPVARQMGRIAREGPATPAAIARLMEEADRGPALTYAQIAREADRQVGRPFRVSGRILELAQIGNTTSALIAVSGDRRRPMMVSHPGTPRLAQGDTIEAVGYLAGLFPHHSPSRGPITVPALAAKAMQPVEKEKRSR